MLILNKSGRRLVTVIEGVGATALVPDLQLKRLRHNYNLSALAMQYLQISSTIKLKIEETSKEKHSLMRKLVGYRNWRQRWCKKDGNKVVGKEKCDKNPIFSTSFGSATFTCATYWIIFLFPNGCIKLHKMLLVLPPKGNPSWPDDRSSDLFIATLQTG